MVKVIDVRDIHKCGLAIESINTATRATPGKVKYDLKHMNILIVM